MRRKFEPKNLTEGKIGFLTILKPIKRGSGISYLCRCDCGEEIILAECKLRKGRKSCGCHGIRKNRTCSKVSIGQEFNKLTVIGGSEIINGASVYPLQCLCGNIVYKTASTLLKDNKVYGCQSCANKKNSVLSVKSRQEKLGPGESEKKLLICSYKANAKQRNLSFELTTEECELLFKDICHYCGVEPYKIKQKSNRGGGYLYNGIDRKNSNIGYVADNCVSCCFRCNLSKRDMPYDVFLNWIKDIYKHRVVLYENNNSG